MKQKSVITVWLAACACMWLATAVSCVERSEHQHVIEANDHYVVTADSVIEGAWVATAISPTHIVSNYSPGGRLATREWSVEQENPRWSTFSSGQALVDAVYNLSIDKIDRMLAHAPDSAFTAGSDIDHEACMAIALALAHLAPQQSKRALLAMTADGAVTPWPDGAPVMSGHLMWACAAWQVYCATGDRQWLRQAHQIVLRTLEREKEITVDRRTGLLHGAPPYRGDMAHFPAWMTPAHMMEMTSLTANAMLLNAFTVARDMGDELDHINDYGDQAARLQDAINHSLWNESRGYYSQWCTGTIEAAQSPRIDNLGQALAIVWGIADDDRAETLVEETPWQPWGLGLTYPPVEGAHPLAQGSSAMLQAVWSMAAAHVGNTHMVRLGLASLLRQQALMAACDVVCNPSTGDLTAGHLALANAAGTIAMTHRVLAGINYLPDGIEFNPCVPSCLTGDKVISNLRYRNATLTITIHGTGNEIKHMRIDDKKVEGNFVGGDISGDHRIDITLTGDDNGSVTQAVPGRVLPQSPLVTWNDSTFIIRHMLDNHGYRLAVNGDPTYWLDNDTTTLLQIPMARELSVIAINKHGASLPSNPHIVTPYWSIVVVDSLARADDDRLTATFSVDAAGDYVARARYAPPLARHAIATMLVNTHPQATLLLPAAARDSTGATAPANNVRLKLLKGKNTITLKPVDGGEGLKQLQYIELIKLF